MTFPRNVGQIPIYYNYKNTGRPQPKGAAQKFRSNYLDVSNDPLFPFGYGLSYTSFNYSEIQLTDTVLRAGRSITAAATITNSGSFDGEEVVQLYIYDPVASVTQPLKKLKGFQKIALKKGESRIVSFRITEEELKFINSSLQWIAAPGAFRLFIGTNSQETKQADFKFVK